VRIKDLQLLPKFRDGWSYLYVEHCRIDRENRAVALHDASGTVSVPCAGLALLMLGPGVSITHAAIMTLADNGCLVVWCGEEGIRFYAAGLGKTRNASNLLRQVALVSDPAMREKVVRRMYSVRFRKKLPSGLTLRQIRGMEGVRVRDAYAKAAREYGIEWKGRSYRRDSWKDTDPVNRALSTANSCLYGLCHAGIVACGLSPALGFVHTGNMLSFVFDIADLYKVDVSVPVAFREAAKGGEELDRRVRRALRDSIVSFRLLPRVVDDLYYLLGLGRKNADDPFEADDELPPPLWDPERGVVAGGVNYADAEVSDDGADLGASQAGLAR